MIRRNTCNCLKDIIQTIYDNDMLLDEQEKISLVFLMCDDAAKAIDILTQNLIKNYEPSKVLPDLFNFLSCDEVSLRNKFVESLCLIGNFKLLILWGYNRLEIENFKKIYQNNKSTNHINLVRKKLYKMCENLSLDELLDFINLVKGDFAKKNSIMPHYSAPHIEVILLHCIQEGYIKDGTGNTQCDVSSFTTHLKSLKKNYLAKELENIPLSRNELYKDNDSMEQCLKANFFPEYIRRLKDDDLYIMDKANMGLCIIVNQRNYANTNFSNVETVRHGTNNDRDMLHITFTGFGYNVIILENETSSSLRKKLKIIIERDVLERHSSLFMCILSHGNRDSIYCVDGVEISVRELENMVLGNECPQLLGKPKIIFIQACQGNTMQRAQPRVLNLQETTLECDAPGQEVMRTMVPPTADLLTYCATVPGYVSFRLPYSGSIFIQVLCSQLLKLGNSAHLVDIVTSVNNELSKKPFGTKCNVVMSQMPQARHTITKKLYFPYSLQHRKEAADMLFFKYLVEFLLNECIIKAAAAQYYISKRNC